MGYGWVRLYCFTDISASVPVCILRLAYCIVGSCALRKLSPQAFVLRNLGEMIVIAGNLATKLMALFSYCYNTKRV